MQHSCGCINDFTCALECSFGIKSISRYSKFKFIASERSCYVLVEDKDKELLWKIRKAIYIKRESSPTLRRPLLATPEEDVSHRKLHHPSVAFKLKTEFGNSENDHGLTFFFKFIMHVSVSANCLLIDCGQTFIHSAFSLCLPLKDLSFQGLGNLW